MIISIHLSYVSNYGLDLFIYFTFNQLYQSSTSEFETLDKNARQVNTWSLGSNHQYSSLKKTQQMIHNSLWTDTEQKISRTG